MTNKIKCPFCGSETKKTDFKLDAVEICTNCHAHKDYEPELKKYIWRYR